MTLPNYDDWKTGVEEYRSAAEEAEEAAEELFLLNKLAAAEDTLLGALEDAMIVYSDTTGRDAKHKCLELINEMP